MYYSVQSTHSTKQGKGKGKGRGGEGRGGRGEGERRKKWEDREGYTFSSPLEVPNNRKPSSCSKAIAEGEVGKPCTTDCTGEGSKQSESTALCCRLVGPLGLSLHQGDAILTFL